jgi:hypothetical protein
MKNKLNTPVLFLIYRRSDTAKKVFEEIKKARPKKLFIAADGPKEGEEEKCQRARDIVMNNIDWECKVKTLFRDKNLGCKYAVSGAIDWFFHNVEEGIILEDDTLPNQSFFRFCEELLERYRDDERIMHISGYNHFGELKNYKYSYVFSKYTPIWGWATWRRAWQFYDVNISTYPQFKEEGQIYNIFRTERERKHRIKILDKLYNNKIDTWDYQWNYCVRINNGLSIIPVKNLVSNLGLSGESTHTKEDKRLSKNIKREIDFPLRNSLFKLIDEKRDFILFQSFVNKKNISLSLKAMMPKTVKNWVKIFLSL